MDLVQLIAPVVSDPAAVWSVALGLALWAVLSGVALRTGTGRLVTALRRATLDLKKAPDAQRFAENFVGFSERMARDPVLGERWSEYRASLALPAPGSGSAVRATARPDQWFDQTLLRAPSVRVDARYHAALPNLLVGGGLLFTFLGLAVALHSAGDIVSGATAADRNGALRQMLSAASLKFWTSVAGLFASITFSLYRKARLRHVEAAIDGFIAALEIRIPLLTQASAQQEANELAREQMRVLGRLADKIGNSNEAALGSMLDNFLDRLNGGASSRMDDVVHKLAGLGDSLAGLQAGLGEAASRISTSAGSVADVMGEGTDSAFGRVATRLDAVSDGLERSARDVALAFAEAGERFQASLGAGAQGLASLLEASGARIAEALARSASESGGAFGRGADEAVARIAGSIEAMRVEMQAMSSDLHAAIHAAGDVFAASTRQGAEALAHSAAGAGASLEAAALNAAGTLERGGAHFGERLVASGDLVALRTEALAQEGGLLAQATNNAADRLSTFAHVLERAADPLAQATGDLRATGAAANDAVAPLTTIAAYMTEASRQMSDTAARLADAHSASTRLVESIDRASGRFEGVDRELAKTLEGLQEGLRGFTVSIDAFVGRTDANLARAAAQLLTVAEQLTTSVDALVETLEVQKVAAE